jgi:hypothetical protein
MNNLTAIKGGEITTPKESPMLRVYSDFSAKDEKPSTPKAKADRE